MIVTEEEANLRLESPDNLINKLGTNIQIKDLHSNRNGRGHIPPMIQTLAVALGKVDTQSAAAQEFGMSPGNVSYLTREGKNVDRSVVKEAVATVHSNALDAMLESISLLKPKLKDVRKCTDLSKIASDMAAVVKRTSVEEKTNDTRLVVVAYAPRQKDESEFEVSVIEAAPQA